MEAPAKASLLFLFGQHPCGAWERPGAASASRSSPLAAWRPGLVIKTSSSLTPIPAPVGEGADDVGSLVELVGRDQPRLLDCGAKPERLPSSGACGLRRLRAGEPCSNQRR
jgi:hypothetical protein